MLSQGAEITYMRNLPKYVTTPGLFRTRPIHSKWQFLKAVLLDCYDPLIQNRGRKGLIAVSCGYTFHRPGSRQSWATLVDR